jgi:hypothetical protein
VSVIMMVQPSAGTSARFVRNAVEPPSLVIDDGTTTVVFCPANIAGGLTEAAQFAQALALVVGEWEAGCRGALAATESEDPFNVDALVAEYGHPAPGDGDQA